ncbi:MULTISPECIES: hypothetical protein [unclassified Microbacterium]|uniref:hypothetical protein n=1 Tax=unclassified Microbacterium TaxID=2609290 RepID=UPI0038636A8E
MSSLRSEILGLPDGSPAFRLLLPEGWTANKISEETAESFEEQARAVFMRAGRPDLDGAFASMMRRGMRDLERSGARYVLLPGASSDGTVPPISLIVSVVSGEGGATLDGWVSARFREGAQMLDEGGRIVHWRARKPGTETGVEQVQSSYVIPMPETNRTKALMLTGTVMVDADATDDADIIVAGGAVFDAIAATVTWMAPVDTSPVR